MSKPIKEQFIDWLRTKPADEEYKYTDANNCAFAQFARDVGIPDPVRYDSHTLPKGFYGPVGDKPWTFGALLDRLTSHDALSSYRTGDEA